MLIQGFMVNFTWQNMLAGLLGVTVGTVAGVLPGIGVSGSVALLLPISFGMEPLTALILFSGIYYGSMYGGSTTSILVNVPGEGASVVTCIEGHEMAKKGRAGAALAIAGIGSFIAGTIGVIALTFFAPSLAEAALKFGPPEYFAISAVGLIILSNLTGGSVLKSMIMVVAGMLIGTIGTDPLFGISRFAYGVDNLEKGIEFIVIIMGTFGMGEVMATICEPQPEATYHKVKFKELYPNKEEAKRSAMPILRGTALGFFMGLIPGPGSTISSFLSYSVEKRNSKHPEEWGHGAIEGVAGPESANNAASSAHMIPLLSLGIPFTASYALLLSGFMIHGITPGPLLVKEHPDIFWGLIASMYIGNILCLILNLPLVGIFAALLKVPMNILMPIVALITFTGAYALNYSVFDLGVLAFFGIFGYVTKKAGFSGAPFAIGAFLGTQIEKGLVQSMVMFRGNIIKLFERPLSATMIAIAMIFILYPILKSMLFKKKGIIIPSESEDF